MTSREPVAVCKARWINSGRCQFSRISGFNGLIASRIAKLIGDKRSKGNGCGEFHGVATSGLASSSERNK